MRTLISTAILLVSLASVPALGAQEGTSRAPLPPQLNSAKKVFVSNAGSDGSLFPGAFKGQPDRTYDEFYAEMKGWGRYKLVLAPADAELVFEIKFVAPIGMVSVMGGNGGSMLDPQLRLVILDQRTHVVFWGFTEHVKPGAAFSKNFDQSMANLLDDVKSVVGPSIPGGAKP
ncbi:MAG: hypothetical protein WCC76_19440 [Candidatus Acidiferrales bacterium]|jgi:hypothetical protein